MDKWRFFCFDPAIFKYLKNDSTILERTPMQKISKKKKLGALKHHGFWQCMDTLRDKEILEKLIKKNKSLVKKNILVLGGTGFIGQNLIRNLSKTKNNITSLSIKRKKRNYNYIKNVEYLFSDISNIKQLKKIINKDYHIVINLSFKY